MFALAAPITGAMGAPLFSGTWNTVTSLNGHFIINMTKATADGSQINGVFINDGNAKYNGTLAGSVLTMVEAVQNMVELAGIPIERVIPMATEVPARILGVADRKGKLDRGFDADVVVLNEKLEGERVFTGGEQVVG